MTEELRSEDAAKCVTVQGWACKKCGRFWGDDEPMARYCCATSFPCKCGGRFAKFQPCCEACRAKGNAKIYASFPGKTWDGEAPLTLWVGDQFFWTSEQLQEYLDDEWLSVEDLSLVFCIPQHGRQFSLYEHLEDVLPDDDSAFCFGTDEKAIEKTVNDWLEAQRPFSWLPDRVRPTLESLKEHISGPPVGNYKECHNFNPEDVCDSDDCPHREVCQPLQEESKK